MNQTEFSSAIANFGGFRFEESAILRVPRDQYAKIRSLKQGQDCPVCAHLQKLSQEPGRSRYDIIKENAQ